MTFNLTTLKGHYYIFHEQCIKFKNFWFWILTQKSEIIWYFINIIYNITSEHNCFHYPFFQFLRRNKIKISKALVYLRLKVQKKNESYNWVVVFHINSICLVGQFYILCSYRFNKLFLSKNIFESRIKSGNKIYS